MKKYILSETGSPILETDLHKWVRWFETAERRVARERVCNSEVSTVFLGLDHSFKEGAPPILWETMVFAGELDNEMDRCSGTREQAEAMHARMVQKVINCAAKAAET